MKICELCGTRHESYQGHVFASNAVVASNEFASNTMVARVGVKQRWSRAAYNAYQREYMRKKRAASR